MTTIIILCLLFSFNIGKVYAQVTDVDGKTYNTIAIGTQVWMAEDLEVTHYRNGDPIQYIPCPQQLNYNQDNQESKAWESTKSGVYCVGLRPRLDVFVKGGRFSCMLYNWYAVNDSRGLAPKGWHIPTKLEWLTLFEYLGGFEVAGKKMKSRNGWDTKYASNGNNISGFNALPTGERDNFGFYMAFSQYAWYWSATSEGDYAYCLQLGWQYNLKFNKSGLNFMTNVRQSGEAIRCIKD